MRLPTVSASLANTALVVIGAHHFGRDRNDPLYNFVKDVPWSQVLLVEAAPAIARHLSAMVASRNPMRRVPSERVRVANQGVCPLPDNATTTLYFHYLPDEAPGLPYWHSQIGAFNMKHVARHFKSLLRKQTPGSNYTEEVLRKMVLREQVMCTSLPTVLRMHGVGRIGALMIDTEGLDCPILASQNWSAPALCEHNPELVLYETKSCSIKGLRDAAATMGGPRRCAGRPMCTCAVCPQT